MTATPTGADKAGGFVLLDSGRVVGLSPTAARVLRTWTGGSPYTWHAPSVGDVPVGGSVRERWHAQTVSDLVLLQVEADEVGLSREWEIANQALASLAPRLMGRLSDRSYREGMTAVFEAIIPDRPLVVLEGENLRVAGARGMRLERAEELRALLSNYHVRQLIREQGVPLSRHSFLVTPVVAMMLGSFPVSASTDTLSNLLVFECHDDLERLVGLLVSEYPQDGLPDPWQLNLIGEVADWIAELVHRRSEEEQNEQTLLLLESLIEHDPGGILVLDGGGRIRRVNEAMERISGFRRDELVGRGLDCLFLPEQVRQLSDRLKRHDVSRLESEMETASGALRPVRAQVYPFPNQGSGYVIQLEDLADTVSLHQKELEMERLQAVFQTAVAFHDRVNTPLSIILAHLERLRYRWEGGLSREDLDRSLAGIEKQVDRITSIVERMRDMKRYRVSEYGVSDISMVHLSDSQEEKTDPSREETGTVAEEMDPEDR